MNEFIKRNFKLLFIGSVILISMLYLVLAGGKYVWSDESFTFALIKHSYSDIWLLTAADVHPPLYYMLLKFFTSFVNYNMFAARMFSAVPYIFIIVFGGIKLNKYFGEKAALLFIWLFFMFPYAMTKAVDVRMYPLAAAFVFANAVYAYGCFLGERKVDWLWLVLSGLGAAYTHYYALVSVGIIYGILLIAFIVKKKSELIKWFAAVLVSIVLFLPWLKCFIDQLKYKVDNEYWIEDITIKTVIGYVRSLFGVRDIKLFFILPVLAYFVAVIIVIKGKEKNAPVSICALLVPLLTAVVGITVSILVRPVFIVRYLAPSIPLLVLFMALALNEINSKTVAVAIIAVSTLGGLLGYVSQVKYEYDIRPAEMSEVFVEKCDDCDAYLIYSDSTQTSMVLAYYDEDTPIYQNRDFTSSKYPYDNIFSLDEFDVKGIDSAVVIVDEGQQLSDKYESLFDCSDIGKVTQNDLAYEVYLLKSK